MTAGVFVPFTEESCVSDYGVLLRFCEDCWPHRHICHLSLENSGFLNISWVLNKRLQIGVQEKKTEEILNE